MSPSPSSFSSSLSSSSFILFFRRRRECSKKVSSFLQPTAKTTFGLCRIENDVVWFIYLFLIQSGNKKSFFSADISSKNWFSAGTEKKKQRKNRSEEKSEKIGKIADFSSKNRKRPIFHQKITIVEHAHLCCNF